MSEAVSVREFDEYKTTHRMEHTMLSKNIDVLHRRIWAIVITGNMVGWSLLGYVLMNGVPWRG